MTAEAGRARIGRPPGSRTSDRDAVIRARASRAQLETFEQLGGADWLRGELDKARKRLDKARTAHARPGGCG